MTDDSPRRLSDEDAAAFVAIVEETFPPHDPAAPRRDHVRELAELLRGAGFEARLNLPPKDR